MAFDLQENGTIDADCETTDETPARLVIMDLADFNSLGVSDAATLKLVVEVIAGTRDRKSHSWSGEATVMLSGGSARFLSVRPTGQTFEQVWEVTPGIEVTSYVIYVTGEAGVTIEWSASIRYEYGGFIPS